MLQIGNGGGVCRHGPAQPKTRSAGGDEPIERPARVRSDTNTHGYNDRYGKIIGISGPDVLFFKTRTWLTFALFVGGTWRVGATDNWTHAHVTGASTAQRTVRQPVSTSLSQSTPRVFRDGPGASYAFRRDATAFLEYQVSRTVAAVVLQPKRIDATRVGRDTANRRDEGIPPPCKPVAGKNVTTLLSFRQVRHKVGPLGIRHFAVFLNGITPLSTGSPHRRTACPERT